MPRKVFTAGEVLAAADVNEFLQDQVIMTFAGTAARGSAIGTATEGMYTHLNDTDTLQYWDGSAWVSAIPASTAAILQVESTTKTNTQVSSAVASGTAVDITGLTVTITPSSASNKILLLAQVNATISTNGVFVAFELFRDSTKIGAGDDEGNRVGITAAAAPTNNGSSLGALTTNINFLDSPSTTSAITYKVRVRNVTGSGTRDIYINRNVDDANTFADSFRSICTLTAMEVAG
jgi:hypothetical protein